MTDVYDDGTLVVGDLLDGRYRIEARIGEGGMGRVYRAQDEQLSRTVAIKTLRGPVDPATIERARAETTVLASLNHHSLVTLFDARITDDDGGYLVLEHVDGHTLRELIARGPVAPAELAAVARDLAEGLHVAHDSGVVHRDIKPANVLLSESPVPGQQWRVKLADFGIAFLLDESDRVTTPGMILGTTAYLAPEQAKGDPPAPAADIYAFGIMLIEAITGVRPFHGAQGIAAVTARLSGPPDIPESLPAQWRGLLRGMTALDPADRPTAAEIAQVTEQLMIRDAAPAAPVIVGAAAGAASAAALDTRLATEAAGAMTAAVPGPGEPTQAHAVDDPPTAVLPPTDGGEPAAQEPSRTRRAAVIVAVVVAILLIAGIGATIWAASLAGSAGPIDTPTPTVSSTPTVDPSAPASPTEPADDTGGSTGDAGTGGGDTGNSGNGNGGGNDNSGPGNNNGGGNGNGNGKP